MNSYQVAVYGNLLQLLCMTSYFQYKNVQGDVITIKWRLPVNFPQISLVWLHILIYMYKAFGLMTIIIIDIWYSALSTYNVQKCFLRKSVDSCYGPYSQINLQNSNVFSSFLKLCTLSAALMLSGSSFQRRGACAQNALSPNLFRLVYGICNKFLVFDLRVLLVLACLTNSSL